MTGKYVVIDVLSTAFMTGGRKSIEAWMRKKEHYSSKGMANTDKRVATENFPRYCLEITRSARKSLTSLSIGYEMIGNS